MTIRQLTQAIASLIGVETLAPVVRDLLDLPPKEQREALAAFYEDAIRAQMESDLPTKAAATRRGGLATIPESRW